MLSAIPPKAGRTASGIPYGKVMSGSLFPSGSCSHPQASGFPASHRSPGSPLPCRLQSHCSHPQHQPDGAAGLTRPKRCCRVPLFHHRASGGMTVVPRSNLIPSAACRAVPACLLTSYETLSAALPETRKMSSPTTLTHAPTSCRISPASHARRGLQGYKHINLRDFPYVFLST